MSGEGEVLYPWSKRGMFRAWLVDAMGIFRRDSDSELYEEAASACREKLNILQATFKQAIWWCKR